MEWCILYFILDTHAPAHVPPVKGLTMQEAKGIVDMTTGENWHRGLYGVAQPFKQAQ